MHVFLILALSGVRCIVIDYPFRYFSVPCSILLSRGAFAVGRYMTIRFPSFLNFSMSLGTPNTARYQYCVSHNKTNAASSESLIFDRMYALLRNKETGLLSTRRWLLSHE